MTYSPNFRGEATMTVENAVITGNTVLNSTGSTLDQLTPVRIDSSGVVATIDVSSETATAISGVMAETVSTGTSGLKAFTGMIENISTSFSHGDVVYVSKTGNLTNQKPSIGVDSFVEGDYVIRIGVIGKNESNPSNYDLHLSINVVGQL